MLLALDVGNTHTVGGVFKDAELVDHWRIGTDARRTADELALVVQGFLAMSGLVGDITGVVICSVVPGATPELRAMVKRYFHCHTVVVEPGVRTGVPILTDNPKEVGADRIVNAVAAFEKMGGGCIVVDFGTATTFDCISPKGEYLGGVIAPGIQISADALFARAAKLPRVEITKPPKVVGRNTVNSMQSGIVYGYVGLVDGLVERLKAELGFPCGVIATGGLARLIAPLSSTIVLVDDELTLTGLRLIYERNVGG